MGGAVRFFGAQRHFTPFAFPFGGRFHRGMAFQSAVNVAAQLGAHGAETVHRHSAFHRGHTAGNFRIDFIFRLAPVVLRIRNDGNRLIKMAAQRQRA